MPSGLALAGAAGGGGGGGPGGGGGGGAEEFGGGGGGGGPPDEGGGGGGAPGVEVGVAAGAGVAESSIRYFLNPEFTYVNQS